MTDFHQLLAQGIETHLEEMQSRDDSGAGLACIVLTRETFLPSIDKHFATIHDHCSAETEETSASKALRPSVSLLSSPAPAISNTAGPLHGLSAIASTPGSAAALVGTKTTLDGGGS